MSRDNTQSIARWILCLIVLFMMAAIPLNSHAALPGLSDSNVLQARSDTIPHGSVISQTTLPAKKALQGITGLYILLLGPVQPTIEVAFTFTTTAGQLNSLPVGADMMKIAFNGTSIQSSTSPITFNAPAGNYSFTAEALNGSTIVSTMGPIPVTVASGYSLSIPLAFAHFPAFDTTQTNVGLDTPNTLIYFGTPDRNRIVQYGGVANDTLIADCDAGNDWVEQYGGNGIDTMTAITGTGNDYVYMEGGDGDDSLQIEGGQGNDWLFQIGGSGNDDIYAIGGDGDDFIWIEGGSGNDTILVRPDVGNDITTIDGGPGDDTITYDVATGIDSAFIDGGEGNDTLIVNNRFGVQPAVPILIRDTNSNIIYQFGSGGTTITVINLEHITVKDGNGNIVFTWP
jgi:Ca2+-binding RTX toxin-like protein